MSHADPIHELLAASGQGRLDDVIHLLESGLTVQSAYKNGCTPLMSAARSYRVEIVEYLIQQGADVNAHTTDFQFILHAAVGETPSQPTRQADCVRMLLDAGATPDVRSESGVTPLMNACWFGCTLAVEVLLNFGADMSLVDNEGRSPRDMAMQKKRNDVIQLLDS